MEGNIVRKSRDPQKQRVIDEMLKNEVGIIEHKDRYFVQSDNYKLNKLLTKYNIGSKYGILVFPRVGDCFRTVMEAYAQLYAVYRCMLNGDPNEGF